VSNEDTSPNGKRKEQRAAGILEAKVGPIRFLF